MGYADTYSNTLVNVSVGEKTFEVKDTGAFKIGMRVRVIAETGPMSATEVLLACPIAYLEGTIIAFISICTINYLMANTA